MEYFKKVFIKSEEDLPKEMITIFAFSDEAGEGFDIKVNPLDQGCLDNLLMFDWYLLPVELPTDEEIEKWIINDANWAKTFINGSIYGAKWMRDKFKDK